MKELLYGAAYYDEYMPYDRLDKDVEMMKKAGINTVRIAESTWSTCEPQPGVFDFSHVERVMDAMEEAGYKLAVSELTMVPQTSVTLDKEETEQFNKIIDALEDDEDVQEEDEGSERRASAPAAAQRDEHAVRELGVHELRQADAHDRGDELGAERGQNDGGR